MEEDDQNEWLEGAEVMSEVHIGCSPSFGYGLSVFEISAFSENENAAIEEKEEGEDVDQMSVGTDEHGDLILPRRKRRRESAKVTGDVVCVHHHITTRLSDVGLQIWKGALLLCDFILQTMTTTGSFKDVVAMDLGAGTGLTGLIMARFARLVFVTDRGTDVLDNCTRNVILNSKSLKHGEASVRVRELDWQKPWRPENSGLSECSSTYQWTPDDIKTAEEEVSVLLAADVVYSPGLTDALFSMLKDLMPHGSKKVLYLAMEKRYNFSLRDQDVVAHGYKHFRTFFTTAMSEEESCESQVDVGRAETVCHFMGNMIDISSVSQYVQNYDRGEDLELWEIRINDS